MITTCTHVYSSMLSFSNTHKQLSSNIHCHSWYTCMSSISQICFWNHTNGKVLIVTVLYMRLIHSPGLSHTGRHKQRSGSQGVGESPSHPASQKSLNVPQPPQRAGSTSGGLRRNESNVSFHESVIGGMGAGGGMSHIASCHNTFVK